eukprot:scaffold19952_cov56-Phaeocystis_antarctica.AAC.2
MVQAVQASAKQCPTEGLNYSTQNYSTHARAAVVKEMPSVRRGGGARVSREAQGEAASADPGARARSRGACRQGEGARRGTRRRARATRRPRGSRVGVKS